MEANRPQSEAFGSKLQFFLSFLCLSISKRDLNTKITTLNIEVCPKSLGAMLQYLYIERGLFSTCKTESLMMHFFFPCLRLVFSTFPSCSQMPVVFYHSVIHGLSFFICYVMPTGLLRAFKTRQKAI